MYGEINLVEIPGDVPNKFARNVVRKIYGSNHKNFVLTDDGEKSEISRREPMGLEIRNLIRSMFIIVKFI